MRMVEKLTAVIARMLAHKLHDQLGQPFIPAVREAIFNSDVSPFNPPEFAQALRRAMRAFAQQGTGVTATVVLTGRRRSEGI